MPSETLRRHYEDTIVTHTPTGTLNLKKSKKNDDRRKAAHIDSNFVKQAEMGKKKGPLAVV
ncbi:hypothetical protein SAMN05518672_102803 [Chitinophaga sp. CF118]|nr:hypothetical protein SAMN05518672_102803 [Chitinophaga sp. CF118]